MLLKSDPFIYCGPGCPTLYYPKLSPAGIPEKDMGRSSFIVHRTSVQPGAFILPSTRSGHTNGGEMESRGINSDYPGELKEKATQTEWVLDTRNNFVFIDASLISEVEYEDTKDHNSVSVVEENQASKNVSSTGSEMTFNESTHKVIDVLEVAIAAPESVLFPPISQQENGSTDQNPSIIDNKDDVQNGD